ncbi:HNH endonuclease signature motif containing protein [Nocardioides sp. W7]|uniref:HNH endonuclease signature motif containing protein n=1 Tax=Nocardioides sp. W7 TaxID=2931390 RepID=UPI001FD2F81B|nr:HNH endonuclease signature motif containing protein [Nocardioides sp. W7]
MANGELHDCDDASALLAFVRAERQAEARASANLLASAVAWAAMHSTDSPDEAASLVPGSQEPVAIAGEGAPLVAEFSVLEFAAALGLSTDAGRIYLGDAVELAHRLPRIYGRVQALDLPVWKARRIAKSTSDLPMEGAAYVDAYLHAVAHKVSIAQLDRTVEEARVTYDPAEGRARREASFEKRHFDIESQQVSFDGTVDVHGTLDLADALDLEDAVARRARELGALGLDVPVDIRRSIAVGDLARRQLSLELNAGEPEGRQRKRPRQVVLHVHLSDAALGTTTSDDLHLARVEETRSFVSADQVRTWCANSDTQVTVKPVIDLDGHVHVDAYETPDRLRERQVLLQHSCVFPWCRKPARRCDCDHIDPAARGGPTCDCNIAPLCRRHHRAKTHTRWRYDKLDDTTFVWRSPNGLLMKRDHAGTIPLDTLQP